ncbi:MAG: hypothetical protein QOH23_2326 [Gaiellaceae bacterium]|nr:hypothetical protein [Gaiellaceae bacterium]
MRSWPCTIFLGAVALSLWRAVDQPSLDIGFGGTTASVVPTDLALGALAVSCVVATVQRGARRISWAWLAAGGCFVLLVLGTALANGAAPFVAGAKLAELAALSLGALIFIRDRRSLEALVDVLLLVTAAADVVGLFDFVRNGGGRQSSFLGEHDFAALATFPLVYGLVLLFEDRPSTRRAGIAIVVGGLGVIFGAALASLVGYYLALAALFVTALSLRRLRLRPVLATLGVTLVVTAGTIGLRAGAGDLGFLQSWFGKPAQRPGQYAGSWSQRLIFIYVGGRIFLDHPILGTGWAGNEPATAYARYLPDARRRFSDQPLRYFPRKDGEFVPQQVYDQVLYELGITGGLFLTAMLVTLFVASERAARIAAGRIALLPGVWTGATCGAIAGEGLFGGTPLAALFWLTIGLVPALASLALEESTGSST